jgi:hypothetical protein
MLPYLTHRIRRHRRPGWHAPPPDPPGRGGEGRGCLTSPSGLTPQRHNDHTTAASPPAAGRRMRYTAVALTVVRGPRAYESDAGRPRRAPHHIPARALRRELHHRHHPHHHHHRAMFVCQGAPPTDPSLVPVPRAARHQHYDSQVGRSGLRMGDRRALAPRAPDPTSRSTRSSSSPPLPAPAHTLRLLHRPSAAPSLSRPTRIAPHDVAALSLSILFSSATRSSSSGPSGSCTHGQATRHTDRYNHRCSVRRAADAPGGGGSSRGEAGGSGARGPGRATARQCSSAD